MGSQRTLSVSTRPFPPAALSPLSWRRHLIRNLSTGFLIVLLLALLAAVTAPGGAPTSSAQTAGRPAAPMSTQAATSQQIETHISNQSGQSSASVTVNGQSVAVPTNGSTQQTITSPDGSQTTVTVSGSQTGSSTRTSVSSHSFSITEQNNQEEVSP